jgi:tetratricopeptide (TPR) repeat protein
VSVIYTRSIAYTSRQPRRRLSGVEVIPGSVRRARLDAGLSLAQVGGDELTRQAIHLIETGKTRPSMRSLRVIAKRLGVPVSTFLLTSDPERSIMHGEHANELDRLCQAHQYARVVEIGRELLTPDASQEVRAVAHFYLGQARRHLVQPDEAVAHLREARQLFDRLGDPWLAAEALDWEASALYLKEDPRSVSLAEEALRRYRSLEPRQPETEARMLEHLGTYLLRHQDYDRAQPYYEEALHVAGSVRDLSRLGRIYHGLSCCHWRLGDLRRATDLAFKAVALYAVENELRPVAAQVALPRVENDLAMLLMRQGMVDRAEEFALSALERLARTGVDRLRSHILLTLGEVRMRQGRLQEALGITEQAMELAARHEEMMAVADGHQQLGEVYAQLSRSALRDHHFAQALAILGAVGLRERQAECRAAYDRVLAEERRRHEKPQASGQASA